MRGEEAVVFDARISVDRFAHVFDDGSRGEFMKSRNNQNVGWSGGFRLIAIVVLAFGLMIPTAAFAQEGEDDVDDETANKVLTLLREGKELYDEEKYQEAYDNFEEAYNLWARPAIQARLGKAAERLGNNEKAVEHYRAYLEERPDGKMAGKVRSNLKGLEEKMPARISLRTKPSGATVYGDAEKSRKLGTTPLDTEIEPGEHTFVIEKEGYTTTSRTYELRAGKEKSATVELPGGGAAAKPEAFGEPEEKSSDESAAAASRKYPDTTKPLAVWGWSATILGVAGLGTGGMYSYLQAQATDDVNSLDRGAQGITRDGVNDMKARARRHHRASLVAYSIGGTMAALGGGLLLHHYLSGDQENADKSAGVEFDVQFTSDGGWAGVRGDF